MSGVAVQTLRTRLLIPLYTPVERLEESVCRFVSWHSAEAVTRRMQLSGFSELLVKLEISLTLSGEIDNSNVKRSMASHHSIPSAAVLYHAVPYPIRWQC